MRLALPRPWGHLHLRVTGPGAGPPVLLLHSLGADLRLWDAVADRLPRLRLVALDAPGHGLSATPPGDWDARDHAADAVAAMDALGLARAAVAGCSLGGLVAQALALDHPGRVAGLLLSNTAARLGSPELWRDRARAVEAGGMAAVAEAVLARWFPPAFRASDDARPWEAMLRRTDPRGYALACGALARGDLTAEVPRIAAPVTMLGGSEDVATPPELVAATAARIPGARLEVIEGAGHLPALDAPDRVARALSDLVERAGV